MEVSDADLLQFVEEEEALDALVNEAGDVFEQQTTSQIGGHVDEGLSFFVCCVFSPSSTN